MTLLTVENLTVFYGGIAALHNATLTLARGEIVTVIGPNGAGKSTLLNAIMGIHPGRGVIHFAGQDLSRLSIEDRVRAGLSLVPEKRELFPTLTVHDNLRLGFFRHRHKGRAPALSALEECYTLFPRLKERRNQQAGTLSGGERQMLAMARALMARPDLLMLDEPSLGLAPLIVSEIFKIIEVLRARDCGILLVEQNARAALRIADRGYVLETGYITFEGPAFDLGADPRLAAMYFGTV